MGNYNWDFSLIINLSACSNPDDSLDLSLNGKGGSGPYLSDVWNFCEINLFVIFKSKNAVL